jgi:hypothetical protein
MELVKNVYEIAESFMKDSKFVTLDEEVIKDTADKMMEAGPSTFPPQQDNQDETIICLSEIIGNAINYCYWYGKSDFRPLGCRASKMYQMVMEGLNYFDWNNFDEVIDKTIQLLSINRFPMLEERKVHLRELVEKDAVDLAYRITKSDHIDYEPFFSELVSDYTGYASDIFLKRASLLFLQLYRKLGWFKESVSVLHVPADYQVPKVLEYFGCIKYSEGLKAMIDYDMLLPKHSIYECEIRAATILACKKIVDLTKWNIADVDGWFWLGSKKIDGPFHLTITSDY